ncbi:uncharacterized protein ACN427_000062 [Glossina fuscipes fuscipes]|uniref:Uncharacterized protein n=1 Tax=Glossina palpalis gambiensis TaxID=67801 RepID=A0A1B0ANZ4_9MUSC
MSQELVVVHSVVILLLVLCMSVTCKVVVVNSKAQHLPVLAEMSKNRQLSFISAATKETNTADFIRLVVMRFIYGLASTMGVEERLEGVFNGAFVPPNADNDLFDFGGLTDYGDGDDDYGDESALENVIAADL